MTVAAGYAADEYRLVGKISGEAPFSGRLVHRGWKTERVKLPRVIRSGDRLPTVLPQKSSDIKPTTTRHPRAWSWGMETA